MEKTNKPWRIEHSWSLNSPVSQQLWTAFGLYTMAVKEVACRGGENKKLAVACTGSFGCMGGHPQLGGSTIPIIAWQRFRWSLLRQWVTTWPYYYSEFCIARPLQEMCCLCSTFLVSFSEQNTQQLPMQFPKVVLHFIFLFSKDTLFLLSHLFNSWEGACMVACNLPLWPADSCRFTCWYAHTA